MRWFAENVAGDRNLAAEPLVAPIRAENHVGLPPATLMVGGFDPLRDEGLGYAEVLRSAGVPVNVIYHEEQTHGYWIVAQLVPSSDAARDVDLAALQAAIGALPVG